MTGSSNQASTAEFEGWDDVGTCATEHELGDLDENYSPYSENEAQIL